MKKILLTLFFLSLIFLLSNSYSYAQTVTTEGVFCGSNSGTYWGIAAKYTSTKLGAGPWTTNFFVDQTGASNCSLYWQVWDIPSYSAASGDTVHWQSACVDPTQLVSPTYVNFVRQGESYYQYTVDVTCSSNYIGGYPASCNTPNNLGYVSSGAKCPSGPYCMVGGYTDGVSCPGAFDGSGSCTCGSNGYTCTCTPPPPTNLSASPWCNGSAYRMTFNWTGSSNATSYNLVWNNPAGNQSVSASSVCSGTSCSFSPAVNYSQNTLINWSVAACNGSNCSAAASGAKTTLAQCPPTTPTLTPTPIPGSWSGLSVTPSCNSTYPTVSQAQFSWNAYSGASSYVLNWATSSKNTGSATTYNVPYSYNTCTSGPGGCSFSYNNTVSWYVQAYNSSGSIISTSPTQTFTTATCSCAAGQTNPYYGCSGTSCVQYNSCGTNTCTGPSDTTSCSSGGGTCMLNTSVLNKKS